MLRRIAPCFFAIIIDALGFGLVYPVLATYFTDVHNPIFSSGTSADARNFYMGISYLLYPLCMFFGSVIMGDLSDIWGRKKVLRLCMFGIGISFLIMGAGVFWSNLWLLFVGRALSGLMAGSQPIAQASISDLSNGSNRAFYMGLISLSYSFGSVLGPFIGGLLSDQSLVSWFNYATPFIVAGVMALLACMWLVSFQETSQPDTDKKLSLLHAINIFTKIFQHRTVAYLSLVFLLMQIGFSIYFQFIIVHMKHVHHYSNWQLGSFQSMLGLGFAIGILLILPQLTKRFNIKSIATTALLATGIAQLVAALITIPSLQWLLAIIIATSDMVAFSAMLTLFSFAVSKQLYGWVMGVSSAVMAIAWVISGLGANLFGIISIGQFIFIGGVVLVLAGFLLWYCRSVAYFTT